MIEARTVDEAYSSACNTDDLTVKAERRSDADVLIAAGLSPGILGHALMRLHGEWDAAAKPARITQTDATLLYGQLKSLPRVLSVIEAWAAQRGLDAPKRLAQAVIAHWLAPGCTHCHGRGHELIVGTPSLGRKCKVCNGTGKRKEPAGEAGRQALNMFDECVQVARASMSKRLRQTHG